VAHHRWTWVHFSSPNPTQPTMLTQPTRHIPSWNADTSTVEPIFYMSLISQLCLLKNKGKRISISVIPVYCSRSKKTNFKGELGAMKSMSFAHPRHGGLIRIQPQSLFSPAIFRFTEQKQFMAHFNYQIVWPEQNDQRRYGDFITCDHPRLIVKRMNGKIDEAFMSFNSTCRIGLT